tara:strand:+ start:8136 stop:8951 length:816 start_codon:yes stop_codon:yes gene_type:complete
MLSVIHLLCLATGFYAMGMRAYLLGLPMSKENMSRVFAADNLAGLIAIAWYGSGLLRAFGGFEKGASYYLSNELFLGKIALLVLILIIECVPMLTLIQWRRLRKKGEVPDTKKAPLLQLLTRIELGLIMVIVVLATLMARGIGVHSAPPNPRQDPHKAMLKQHKKRPKVRPAKKWPAFKIDGKPVALDKGKRVYTTNCMVCHQEDGRGMEGSIGADFVGDKSRLAKTDKQLLRSISDGVKGTSMVGWKHKLDAPQRRDVLGYIRYTFGKRK